MVKIKVRRREEYIQKENQAVFKGYRTNSGYPWLLRVKRVKSLFINGRVTLLPVFLSGHGPF
jgi:hypothetical protein